MGQFPDRIETEGTQLRRMEERDLPTLMRHLGDPSIAGWMAGARYPFTREAAEEILSLARGSAQRIRVLDRAGAMIGCLGLSPDVWFWLDPQEQGRGVMSKAMLAACDAHFTRAAHPLLATCRDDNPASQRLLCGLGFSRKSAGRRMFFPAEGRSIACHEYVMTSEQWMLLHPPTLHAGSTTLRPATLKDAAGLGLMLPRPGQDRSDLWPCAEDLEAFIEHNRCRAPRSGLFVIEDSLRRLIGMALLTGRGRPPPLRFTTAEEATRHRAKVMVELSEPE